MNISVPQLIELVLVSRGLSSDEIQFFVDHTKSDMNIEEMKYKWEKEFQRTEDEYCHFKQIVNHICFKVLGLN